MKVNEREKWCVYIAQTINGHFYTGVTNNLTKRITAHKNGKGAKFFRMHPFKQLVYKEEKNNKPQALKRECEIKNLSREGKEKLIEEVKKLDQL